MKWGKKHILVIICLIIFLGAVIFFGRRTNEYQSQNARLQDQNEKLQTEIQNRQAALNRQAYENALNSPDEHIRMNSTQLLAQSKAKKEAEKIFGIMLTFYSGDDYNSRSEEVKPYTTENVRKSRDLFGSDDDGTGESYIDASGLRSSYVGLKFASGILEGYKLPVIIRAASDSWFSGKAKSRQSDVFVGTYDYQKDKFTDLKLLNNLTQENIG